MEPDSGQTSVGLATCGADQLGMESAAEARWELLAHVCQYQHEGATRQEIADRLNLEGIPTDVGQRWDLMEIERLLARTDGRFTFSISKENSVGRQNWDTGFETYGEAVANLPRSRKYQVVVAWKDLP